MINVCQFRLQTAGNTVNALACDLALYGATAAPILEDTLPPSTFPASGIEICESFVAGQDGRAGVVASSVRLQIGGAAAPYSVKASWKMTADKPLGPTVKDVVVLQVAYSGPANASGVGGSFYVMTSDSLIFTVPVTCVSDSFSWDFS